MPLRIALYVAACLLCQPLVAQPFLYYRGGRNAASLMPPDHPSGGVALGSIFTLSGNNLGPADGTLDSVSVTVSQGAVSLGAIPVSASPSQVSAIMPPNAPPGSVSVRVTYSGRRSNAVSVNVVNSTVGLYSLNGLGFGPAAAQNLGDDGTPTPNTGQTPAQPEQTVVLSSTGLGPSPDVPLEIFVGGQPADVVSAGPADCCQGQDQIAFTVPDAAATGCYVPVQVRTNGAIVSNTVTIAISSDGSPCTDLLNPVTSAFPNGGNIGLVLPRRIVARVESPPDPPADVTTDWMFAEFQQIAPGSLFLSPEVLLPPAGACTAFGTDQSTFHVRLPAATELDAGTSMTLTGPAGKVSVTGRPDFAELLGKAPALPKDPAPFYSGAGPFNFSLAGGKVGPVSGSFTMPALPTWTNRDQITTVDRSQPLTVTWTGVDDSSIVLIVGRSSDVPHLVHGIFLCTAGAADGTFTVPQYVLAALPASVTANSVPAAEVWVGAAAVLNPQTFSGSGLDAGFIIPSAFSAKTVVMQ